MDPDLVREQAEAEREALALLRKKPAGPAPANAASIPYAILADAVQDAAPPPHEEPAAIPAMTALQAPAAALPDAQPPEPQAAPAPRRGGLSVAARLGRFISFGLAGAMLGGGLGIVAVNYMQLPADLAKLAIFGPAAVLAGACAIASLYAEASYE